MKLNLIQNDVVLLNQTMPFVFKWTTTPFDILPLSSRCAHVWTRFRVWPLGRDLWLLPLSERSSKHLLYQSNIAHYKHNHVQGRNSIVKWLVAWRNFLWWGVRHISYRVSRCTCSHISFSYVQLWPDIIWTLKKEGIGRERLRERGFRSYLQAELVNHQRYCQN